MQEPDDHELMARLRDGDQEALRGLIERYQSALVNYFGRLGAQQDGDDLAQETFVRLYQYRNRYEPRAKFTTFLFTLARHAWADRGRKSARLERVRRRLMEQPDRMATGPTGDGLDVRSALAQLPEKLRMVLVLNYYEGMGYEEIGRVLKVPVGTVKSRVFLAMLRLREMFHEDHTE